MMCYCDRLSAGMCEEEYSILRACLYVNTDHLIDHVSSSDCHGDVITHIITHIHRDGRRQQH